MFRCRMIHFVFEIFPFRIWQGFLIRHHIEKCVSCQKEIASIEEAKPFLIQENEVENLDGVRPAIKRRTDQERKKVRHFLRLRPRWAAGVAAFVFTVIVGIWLISVILPKKGPLNEPAVERFQIDYIRVENKPARAYIFRPHDSKMVIIWAEKNM